MDSICEYSNCESGTNIVISGHSFCSRHGIKAILDDWKNNDIVVAWLNEKIDTYLETKDNTTRSDWYATEYSYAFKEIGDFCIWLLSLESDRDPGTDAVESG